MINENEDFKLPAKTAGTAMVDNTGTELAEKEDMQLDRVRLSDIICRELIHKAIDMLRFSYTPYSDFKVGAALLTKSNKVYGGCNIENAAYGPSNCAERTAFFKAVSEGEREFAAIAVVGGPNGVIKDFAPPCGVCRQVMMEFCNPQNFYIILARSEEDYSVFTLEELLPMGFGPGNLA